jgi:spermidine/putrescine transport system ATP-binding protein
MSDSGQAVRQGPAPGGEPGGTSHLDESRPGEAIRFEGVTKRFGRTTAVEELSLSIRPGEFFSLLGPSGCGKTTTLRMVAGFEQPSEGRIFLEGEPVETVPPYRRNVNTVFQSYALFEHLDVAENVAFGLKRRKVPSEEVATRVRSALELVQLTGREQARPRELSGGQKQRVALARALVNRPSVLLLDEPLGALDLKLRKQMQVELKQIQREVGITFVYVTHDQEEALAMSDRIAVMHEGRVIQCGEPEEVYERPTETFVADFIGISNLIEGTAEEGGQVLIGSDTRVPAPVPDGCAAGETVRIAVRPEKIALDEVEAGMVSLQGVVEQRVYLGMTSQVTVSLGSGARLVALEQLTYRARADDRWEPGRQVTVGWHPEHCLVLR